MSWYQRWAAIPDDESDQALFTAFNAELHADPAEHLGGAESCETAYHLLIGAPLDLRLDSDVSIEAIAEFLGAQIGVEINTRMVDGQEMLRYGVLGPLPEQGVVGLAEGVTEDDLTKASRVAHAPQGPKGVGRAGQT